MEIPHDGKISISTEIQEQLGLLPGTEIELNVIGNALQLQKKHHPGRGQALVDLMRGKATASLNTDAIMQLIRHIGD